MLPLLPSGDNLGAKQEQREHPAGVWGLLWRREGRQEWVHLDKADSKTGSRGEVSDGVGGEEGITQPESGKHSPQDPVVTCLGARWNINKYPNQAQLDQTVKEGGERLSYKRL